MTSYRASQRPVCDVTIGHVTCFSSILQNKPYKRYAKHITQTQTDKSGRTALYNTLCNDCMDVFVIPITNSPRILCFLPRTDGDLQFVREALTVTRTSSSNQRRRVPELCS